MVPQSCRPGRPARQRRQPLRWRSTAPLGVSVQQQLVWARLRHCYFLEDCYSREFWILINLSCLLISSMSDKSREFPVHPMNRNLLLSTTSLANHFHFMNPNDGWGFKYAIHYSLVI